MSAETRFSTLIAALMPVFETGMEDAPSICNIRAQMLRVAFETVEKKLKQYLQNNHSRLVGHEKAVREKLLTVINLGLEDAFHDLAVRANTLPRKHANAPLEPAAEVPWWPPFQQAGSVVGQRTPTASRNAPRIGVRSLPNLLDARQQSASNRRLGRKGGSG